MRDNPVKQMIIDTTNKAKDMFSILSERLVVHKHLWVTNFHKNPKTTKSRAG